MVAWVTNNRCWSSCLDEAKTPYQTFNVSISSCYVLYITALKLVWYRYVRPLKTNLVKVCLKFPQSLVLAVAQVAGGVQLILVPIELEIKS